MKKNKYLIAGGIASAIASLLHIAIIAGGPEWYRFFGAGEGMARLAETGSTYPSMITIAIAIILALWALYAFSGAGMIKRLPLLKPALGIISLIYIARGIFGIPAVMYLDDPYLNELENKMIFMIFSSVISLGFGMLYLVGLKQVLSKKVNINSAEI